MTVQTVHRPPEILDLQVPQRWHVWKNIAKLGWTSWNPHISRGLRASMSTCKFSMISRGNRVCFEVFCLGSLYIRWFILVGEKANIFRSWTESLMLQDRANTRSSNWPTTRNSGRNLWLAVEGFFWTWFSCFSGVFGCFFEDVIFYAPKILRLWDQTSMKPSKAAVGWRRMPRTC